MAYHFCRIFRFLQSGLDERHLAAVLLENDKILPQDPLLSFQSRPVATTLGRFRLIKMNSQKAQKLTKEELEQVNGGKVTVQDILKSTTAILMFL